jgi:diamine N-acetyltransferase
MVVSSHHAQATCPETPKTPPLSFRFVEADALDVVLPLLMALAKDNQAQAPQTEHVVMQRWLACFDYNYTCLLMEDTETGQALGLCGLWSTMRHYCGKSLELDHVIVSPQHQGRGLGEAMMNYIKLYARQQGYDALELNHYQSNTGAARFYERQGFKTPGHHLIQFLGL